MALVFRTTIQDVEYIAPATIEELVEIKARYGDKAAILAGGTVILSLLRMGLRYEYLVDIKRVRELASIEHSEGKGISIGSAVRLREIEENSVIRDRYGVLWEAVRQIGDHHLRNRATIGGNILNPTLQADTIPPLLVLGAYVDIISIRGVRRAPLKSLVSGDQSLGSDEILARIYIPEPPRGSRGGYFKVWWIMGIAAHIERIDSLGERRVRIAYTSASKKPLLIEDLDEIFRQDKSPGDLIREAIEHIRIRIDPPTDPRASREYREHLVEFGTAYLLRRLLSMG